VERKLRTAQLHGKQRRNDVPLRSGRRASVSHVSPTVAIDANGAFGHLLRRVSAEDSCAANLVTRNGDGRSGPGMDRGADDHFQAAYLRTKPAYAETPW